MESSGSSFKISYSRSRPAEIPKGHPWILPANVLGDLLVLQWAVNTGLNIPVWLVSTHSWVLGGIMILRTDDDRSPKRDVMVQLHNPWATGWPPSSTGVRAPLPQLTVAVTGTLASLSQCDTAWTSKFTITMVECRPEFTSFNSTHLRISDALSMSLGSRSVIARHQKATHPNFDKDLGWITFVAASTSPEKA